MDKSIDKSNLNKTLQDFPQQFTDALRFTKEIRTLGEFDEVLVCGMGGSALPADILATYLTAAGEKLPIRICRDYTLPSTANNQTLVLASSYSGNTEETLSAFAQARKRGLQVVGFSKGGELLDLCRANNYPCVVYPDLGPDFQPRYASGYAFAAMASVLAHTGLIKEERLLEIAALPDFLARYQLAKQGEEAAKQVKGSIPLVYSSEKYLTSLARIIKIKFNESSKTQSFFNAFPELNHNEMIGFTNLLSRYTALIFFDPAEHPQTLKRMRITADLLRQKGVNLLNFELQGESTLQKIFYGLYLGDWIAYYLALLNGVDPTPVAMVEELKAKLK